MICTFYSYKGGVGRSMAMANIGEWLYLHGLRVVLIDWDLEAPGLEVFFPADTSALPLSRQPGLIDLLLDFKEDLPYLTLPVDSSAPDEARLAMSSSSAVAAPTVSVEEVVDALTEQLPPLRTHLYPLREPVSSTSGDSALWILPAGRRADQTFSSYAQAVQRFDWAEFYTRFHGEAFYEWLRRELLADDLADIVLIDTRTGISEMGGAATRQLADVIVSFCVMNAQSLAGVIEMSQSFQRPEILQARDRPLQQLVIPTRIDNNETDFRNAARRQFTLELQRFTGSSDPRTAESMWDLRIPYVPKYAYRETLAVGAPDANEELVAAYEAISRRLIELAPEGSRARRLADIGLTAPRSQRVALPKISNVPPRLSIVVGRKGLLEEMRSRLTELAAPLVLHGLDGIGKTTAAIEFAHRYQPDYDLTWWIDASSAERVAVGFVELAGKLGLGGEPDQALAAVRRWLAANTGWLLVFDGGNDPEILSPHVPREQSGHVVITSINASWGQLAVGLEVPLLDHREATELLQRRTGDPRIELADRLAALLGDLPLALEQAAAYMEASGRPISSYIELLEQEGTRLLRQSTSTAAATPSVGELWERSYRDLLRYPPSRDLLALCSMLAPSPVPLDTLALGAKGREGGFPLLADPFGLDDAVANLKRYSFASARQEGLDVHTLLRSFVHGWLGDDMARRWAATAVDVLLAALADEAGRLRPEAVRLLPHAEAAVEHAITRRAAPAEVVELLSALARQEQTQGHPDVARETMARAVNQATSALPPNHPVTDATVQAHVALLAEQGDIPSAALALEQEVERARKFGLKWLPRLLGDLAGIRMSVGDLDGAESLTREGVALADEGHQHALGTRLRINLGLILMVKGDHSGAMATAQKAVAQIETVAARDPEALDLAALAHKVIEGGSPSLSDVVFSPEFLAQELLHAPEESETELA